MPITRWSAAGTTTYDSTFFHGGAASFYFAADVQLDAYVLQAPPGMLDDTYYGLGGFFWRFAGGPGRITVPPDGSLFEMNNLYRAGQFATYTTGSTGAWEHVTGVGRRLGGGAWGNVTDSVRWGALMGSPASGYLDDAYVIRLASVEIDPRPADLAASTAAAMLRIDGADEAEQYLPSLTTVAGEVTLTLVPGRPLGRTVSSCTGPHDLVGLWGTARNYILLWEDDASAYLEVQASGMLAQLSVGAPFQPGVPVDVTIRYDAASVSLVTSSGIGVQLGMPGVLQVAPGLAVLGAAPGGVSRCDLQLALPGVIEVP